MPKPVTTVLVCVVVSAAAVLLSVLEGSAVMGGDRVTPLVAALSFAIAALIERRP